MSSKENKIKNSESNNSSSSLASMDSCAKSYDSIQEGFFYKNSSAFKQKNDSCSSFLSTDSSDFKEDNEKPIHKVNNYLADEKITRRRERKFSNPNSKSPQVKDVLKFLTYINTSQSNENINDDYFIGFE